MKLKNLRHHAEFSDMARKIREIGDNRDLIYVQNNGNWGDRLIHEGAIQIFQDNSINCENFSGKGELEKRLQTDAQFRERAAKSVLLYGGSGGWGPVWTNAARGVKSFAPYFHHVIVLPTSYGAPAISASNITYFRRDLTESHKSVPNSIFCHDTAFYYDTELSLRPPQVDIGYFCRTDKEQNANGQHHIYNLDLSLVGSYKSKIAPFFQILSVYKKVHTDRLHVSIASLLLGLEVEILPGSYWKARSIFDSSIKDNYPGVTFLEWK